MGLKIVTDAASEPITTALAKLWTRIETTADDDIVTLLLQAARKEAEALTGRYFVTRTVALHLDAFPDAEIRLEAPPIVQVDHVKYYDTSGVLTTIAAGNYTFEQSHGDPPAVAWLVPAYGYTWPTTLGVANAVEVQYQCGFATCPGDVKAYILASLSAMYAQRELIARSDRAPKVVEHLAGLLDAYRIYRA